MPHRTQEELEAGLEEVLAAPREQGTVELVVRRPATDQREILDVGELDPARGLIGDSWERRGSSRTPDHSPHPEMQITLMSARVAGLVAGPRERWALAGDQLFVDLDLSESNLPPGTRLAAGDAELEVTAQPHLGCRKFVARFGAAALEFVNARDRRALHLRGIYARVVHAGKVRPGETIRKL